MGAAVAAAGAAAGLIPKPCVRPLAAAAGAPSTALSSPQSLVKPPHLSLASLSLHSGPRESASRALRRYEALSRATLAQATSTGDGAAAADGAVRAGATFQGNETVGTVMTSMVCPHPCPPRSRPAPWPFLPCPACLALGSAALGFACWLKQTGRGVSPRLLSRTNELRSPEAQERQTFVVGPKHEPAVALQDVPLPDVALRPLLSWQ